MITKMFVKELEELLDKHSIDKLTDVPVVILADYVAENIHSLQKLNRLVRISEDRDKIPG